MTMAENDDHRGHDLVVLTSVFASLSIGSTALRLTVRKLNRQLGWDDLTIFLAVICSIAAWIAIVIAVQHGYGSHIYFLSDEQIELALQGLWALQFSFCFAVPLAKVSICFFVLRIKGKGALKWFLYGMMAGLFLTNLAPLIVLCAQCQPVRAYWDRSAGTCWSPEVYNTAIWVGVGKNSARHLHVWEESAQLITVSAFNLLADFTLSLLPIVVLWNVKIKLRMKYLISCLMSLGLL